MYKIKKKAHIRLIGLLGISVTVFCLLLKIFYCDRLPVEETQNVAIILGLIVGFSLMNSAALLELRSRVETLERRR